MHELIQKIINVLIPIEEKKQRIEETIQILKPTFDDRTDKVVEKILKDNTPFLHALKISEEADKIDYHTPTLSSLRVRVLDVLVGIIRDFNKAKMINAYLQADFDKGVKLSKIDEILYNTNLFLFSFIYAPDFDKAITFGEKALSLIEPEEQLVEEKLRLFSNLIQYYSLAGLLDKAQKFVEKGKQYFPASQSNAYNALYVLAVATYHNERGEFEEVISLVESHSSLLEKQNAYPSMYSFTLNQLCEALVKKGKVSEAENMLNFTEKVGREFYSAEDNNFFAKLFANHAINKFSKKEQLTISKERLEKALHIYRKIYCGEDKHKNQGSVHLYLGKLHFLNQQYNEAKDHCLKSEKIYDTALKGKQIFDLSELYKLLAIIGVELKEESLTYTYFKKQLAAFGIDHPNTAEITLYVDKKGLSLPF